MKECVCSKCLIENECAANDWCLFDDNNKKCPNYKEGHAQLVAFMEDYLHGKYDC